MMRSWFQPQPQRQLKSIWKVRVTYTVFGFTCGPRLELAIIVGATGRLPPLVAAANARTTPEWTSLVMLAM